MAERPAPDPPHGRALLAPTQGQALSLAIPNEPRAKFSNAKPLTPAYRVCLHKPVRV
jgi:hypothetical protein